MPISFDVTHTSQVFIYESHIRWMHVLPNDIFWRKLRPNIKHIKSHIERTCCVECRSFADRSRSRGERRTVQVHTTITATASGCTLCDRHDIKKKQRMQTHAHGNQFLLIFFFLRKQKLEKKIKINTEIIRLLYKYGIVIRNLE